MLNRFISISWLILLTCNVYSQDASKFFGEGKLKAQAGNHKAAIGLFTRAIGLAPDSARYYLVRAESYMETGQLEPGFMDLNQALKLDPQYIEAYLNRGIFYYRIHEFEKSVLDYTTALEFVKEDSVRHALLVNRSSSYLKNRNFQQAIDDCRFILQNDSNNVGALNNLAMAMDGVGKGEESIGILKRIIEIDSTLVYPYMNIGFRLTLEEKFAESIPYFDKALQLDPEMAITYNNRGYARFRMNDTDGALTDINKSIKLLPSNPYAYRNRGLVYHHLGKKSKACEDWNTAISYNFTTIHGNEVKELLKANCY